MRVTIQTVSAFPPIRSDSSPITPNLIQFFSCSWKCYGWEKKSGRTAGSQSIYRFSLPCNHIFTDSLHSTSGVFLSTSLSLPVSLAWSTSCLGSLLPCILWYGRLPNWFDRCVAPAIVTINLISRLIKTQNTINFGRYGWAGNGINIKQQICWKLRSAVSLRCRIMFKP